MNYMKKTISDIEDEDVFLKKIIANVNIGLLEKGTNKINQSRVYKTSEEAAFYKNQYGGKVHILRNYSCSTDFGLDVEKIEETQTKDKYYILNNESKAELQNGFRYIKELVLQIHNYKMYEDHQQLISNGVQVFSVKSDAFTILKIDIDNAKDVISFSNEVGGWRNSKIDNIHFPSQKFKTENNYFIKVTEQIIKEVEINNEYDSDEICNVFKEYNRVMVKALFPGCGKSHACKHMETLGYNVLFVCPTNELMRNYKNGITINKLFGMGISDDEKLKAFDTSEFNVIVFDEIYLHDIRKLSKIKKLCLNNPNKIIIATGDTCQIEPITELSNQKDYDIYANECVNNIFNVDVILKIPKRIKGEEQIKFIANLRIDIFSNTGDVNKRLEMIKKIKFKTTNKTFTPNNIAYFNSTCKKVSNNIRSQENRKNEYEIGEGLICKERTVIKPNVLNVNSKFVITKVCDNNTITIKDS